MKRFRLLTILCLAACSTGDAEETPAGSVDAPPEPAPAAATPDGWTATSPRGTEVTVRAEPTPLTAGPVRFEILSPNAPDGPLTVDLVSPSMPMHGIRRYEAVGLENGTWVVEAEIPMEGRWGLYVNLDHGAEAAEFLFEAAPGEEGTDHRHGGPESSGAERVSAATGHDHGGHEGSPDGSEHRR